MLILAFLSLERFLLIAVPFSGHQKLNLSTATYSLTVIWMVGVIIAVAPGTVSSGLSQKPGSKRTGLE